MDAFPHFITSGLCLLDLDLGQKGLQKSLGAFSAISGAWPLSRVRVDHAVASFGAFLTTRSRQSCGRVAASLRLACVRVAHAIAWMPVSSEAPFCAFLPFLYVFFPSFKSFLP
ncbi:uncharacterized protein DS421_11g328130 [Arachis hypogaea]|nr:uncharacterized protein DS421_11g328130 [Arachis hypogaea]